MYLMVAEENQDREFACGIYRPMFGDGRRRNNKADADASTTAFKMTGWLSLLNAQCSVLTREASQPW
jgi:hypothetical protein